MSDEVVTTVVTPAVSYDLTDLATVKDELKITDTTDDAFLARAITQVSKAAANFCNRVFPAETVKDVFYLDRARLINSDASILQLSRYPVVSVSSVVQDAGLTSALTLATNVDYALRSNEAQIVRIDSTSGALLQWNCNTVTAQYVAGYSTIPDDLVEVVLRSVTQRYSGRGRDALLMSRDQPQRGTERWWVGAAPGQDGFFPPELAAILENYRVPVTA